MWLTRKARDVRGGTCWLSYDTFGTTWLFNKTFVEYIFFALMFVLNLYLGMGVIELHFIEPQKKVFKFERELSWRKD